LAVRDDGVAEQVEYYRRRAPVYDQWWARRGSYALPPQLHRQWFEDVAEIEQVVHDFAPTGDVLELACGTGLFTRLLVEHADRVTAVDASPEALELNRQRLPDAAVERVVADVFAWEPPRGAFDSVVFTYWLSHVPDDHLAAFWASVGRALRPGGRVLLVDSAAWPRHDPPPPGARRESRSLPDGGTYTVLKRYWRPDELERDLDARGWDATAGTTAHGMILHARARPAATPPRSGRVTAGTPAPRTGG
jgi:demethylmenaquinone methyltransferase/2-methoxy-6-polyprenyl-1,4-benzoquinol methylase